MPLREIFAHNHDIILFLLFALERGEHASYNWDAV